MEGEGRRGCLRLPPCPPSRSPHGVMADDVGAIPRASRAGTAGYRDRELKGHSWGGRGHVRARSRARKGANDGMKGDNMQGHLAHGLG